MVEGYLDLPNVLQYSSMQNLSSGSFCSASPITTRSGSFALSKIDLIVSLHRSPSEERGRSKIRMRIHSTAAQRCDLF